MYAHMYVRTYVYIYVCMGGMQSTPSSHDTSFGCFLLSSESQALVVGLLLLDLLLVSCIVVVVAVVVVVYVYAYAYIYSWKCDACL